MFVKVKNFEKWLNRRAQKIAVVKDLSDDVTSASKNGTLVSKASVKTEVEKKRDENETEDVVNRGNACLLSIIASDLGTLLHE